MVTFLTSLPFLDHLPHDIVWIILVRVRSSFFSNYFGYRQRSVVSEGPLERVLRMFLLWKRRRQTSCSKSSRKTSDPFNQVVCCKMEKVTLVFGKIISLACEASDFWTTFPKQELGILDCRNTLYQISAITNAFRKNNLKMIAVCADL